VVFHGRIFDVVRDTLTPPGEQTRTREWIRHPGAVAIVPILADGRVCLIENHRHAVGQTLIEIPAGTREPNEDPLETARRELREETGYSADRIELVHEFYMSPGILRERMLLYRATGLAAGDPARESGEEIENLIVSWDEAMVMATDGRIQDAKSLVGILLCERLRQAGL
jgi:ADP-ribose pyrophosphatase